MAKKDEASNAEYIPFNSIDQMPIRVVERDDASIEYADSFFVAHTEDEFILSFIQLQHPMAMTPEDAEKVESMDALVLSRIALTPRRMQAFIQVVQRDWLNFMADRASKQQGKKEGE